MRTPLAIPGLAMLLSGCMASYPVQPYDPVVPRERVTITFDSPRDLEARRDATTYVLPAIRQLHGRVESVRSDTLVLRVLALESSVRQPELPGDARLTLPPDASAHLAHQRIASGRTLGAAFLTLLGVLALAIGTMDWEYDCTSC